MIRIYGYNLPVFGASGSGRALWVGVVLLPLLPPCYADLAPCWAVNRPLLCGKEIDIQSRSNPLISRSIVNDDQLDVDANTKIHPDSAG